MATKPAFLFYSQDFLLGTLALPMEDRGKYITLLCYMHKNGHMSPESVKRLVGVMSKELSAKFKKDDTGKLFSLRLDKEIKDRERFVSSRRNNGTRGGRPHVAKVLANDNSPLLFEDMARSILKGAAQEKSMIPPKPEMVKNCFISRGLSAIDSEYETLKFLAHYTGKGWKTNGNKPIQDWRAAVTNWLVHRNQFLKNKQPKTLTELWLA